MPTKVYTSSGWQTVSSGRDGSANPASPQQSIQFNNAGNFGGTNDLRWTGSALIVEGARIQPSIGSGTNDGIEWSTTALDGVGYIKYYAESGTNTRLEICNSNDANDDIFLNAERVYVGGHLEPAPGSTWDLGTSSYRWNNLYINDLQLSNKSKKDTGGNDIDGTWGDYTIQEGENDLFLVNNRNGKKYKFNLTEIK